MREKTIERGIEKEEEIEIKQYKKGGKARKKERERRRQGESRQ